MSSVDDVPEDERAGRSDRVEDLVADALGDADDTAARHGVPVDLTLDALDEEDGATP